MNEVCLIKNAAGRMVPTTVNQSAAEPFQGIGKFRPQGRKYGRRIPTCADYPADGNKLVPSLKEALIKAGLRDGMIISTHHHFRNGDLIANQIFDIAAELSPPDVAASPVALMPPSRSATRSAVCRFALAPASQRGDRAAKPLRAAPVWLATTATAFGCLTTWLTPRMAKAGAGSTSISLPPRVGLSIRAAYRSSGRRTSMP